MYTRTFDRGRPPACAGFRPFTHLAGREIWLKFPRPTVSMRQRRDRLRSRCRPRSHGVCHTVHLSKSSFGLSSGFSAHSRGATYLNRTAWPVKAIIGPDSTFFRILLRPALGQNSGRLTGEKKAGFANRLRDLMARQFTHPLSQGTADRHEATRQPTRRTANPTLRQINIHPVSGPVNPAQLARRMILSVFCYEF
jgi:hypothetical protein